MLPVSYILNKIMEPQSRSLGGNNGDLRSPQPPNLDDSSISFEEYVSWIAYFPVVESKIWRCIMPPPHESILVGRVPQLKLGNWMLKDSIRSRNRESKARYWMLLETRITSHPPRRMKPKSAKKFPQLLLHPQPWKLQIMNTSRPRELCVQLPGVRCSILSLPMFLGLGPLGKLVYSGTPSNL